MVPSMFLLSTQIQNIKMRSSKLVIKSNAQKQMVIFGFGCKFHSLKYVELGILFPICSIYYKLEGNIKYIIKYLM